VRAVVVLAFGLVLAACGGPAASPLTDPGEILRSGAASLTALKTVHVQGVVDGEIAVGAGSAGGGGPLDLDGTTIVVDLDAAARALSVQVAAPALLNMRLDLVVRDGTAYLRLPIVTGQRWVRQRAGGPLTADPAAVIHGLASFLARPDLAPARLADARCGGTDCYVVRFTVAAAVVRAALGSPGTAIPGLGSAVGDVPVTVGVRRSDLRLATLALDVPAGGAKPLAIRLELSRFDETPAITAPPADEVDSAPGG